MYSKLTNETKIKSEPDFLFCENKDKNRLRRKLSRAEETLGMVSQPYIPGVDQPWSPQVCLETHRLFSPLNFEPLLVSALAGRVSSRAKCQCCKGS